MPEPRDHQRLYEDLAQLCVGRQDANHREAFLILAGDCALAAGQTEDAERLRQRLLEAAPHNLFRPFASFAEALESSDIREYVQDLRQQFPPEWSEGLLQDWRRDSEAQSDGNRPGVLDNLFTDADLETGYEPFASLKDVGFVLPPEPAPKPAAPPPPKNPPRDQATRPGSSASVKSYILQDVSPQPGPTKRPPGKGSRANPFIPPLPAGRPRAVDFIGAGIIYLLIGLVGLGGFGLLGYVLARPFLNM